MTPEQIAQKHENRPGFQLVDFAEVGLPMYRLLIDVVLLDRRVVPSTQEFILKLIDAGISESANLMGFLGLEQRLFLASTNTLLENGWINLGEDENFTLTRKGKLVLDEGVDASPQDETIMIDFDGTTRSPINLIKELYSKPSDLRNSGKIEIRPYPALPPETYDLDLQTVQKVFKKQAGRQVERKEVLAINRIAKKTRLYRNALCLVYKSEKSKNIELDFFINGVRSEEHSNQFALNGGPQKMGFHESITSADIRKTLIRQLPKETQSLLPPEQETHKLRVEAAAAQMLLDSGQRKLPRTKEHARKRKIQEEIDNSINRLDKAKTALSDFPVRSVAVYEYTSLLAEALENTIHSLIISSPKILETVVDAYFLRSINLLLDQNVNVSVYINGGWATGANDDSNAVKSLKKMAMNNTKFKLGRTRKSPVNWLISDNNFVAITSFPWLSYKESKRPLSRTSGLIAQKPDLTNALRSTFLSRETKE